MNLSPAWIKYLSTEIVCKLATLGRLGYWGKAPGTIGSFAGLIWYTLLFYKASPFTYIVLLGASIYLSIIVCGEAAQRMFKKDPSEVILDEFVAIPLCFMGLEYYMEIYPMWALILLGFGLFRLFDILKPFGISRLQLLEGGLGIVVDDLAAALATCVVMHSLLLLFGAYFKA